jgi:hypothetical protein
LLPTIPNEFTIGEMRAPSSAPAAHRPSDILPIRLDLVIEGAANFSISPEVEEKEASQRHKKNH